MTIWVELAVLNHREPSPPGSACHVAIQIVGVLPRLCAVEAEAALPAVMLTVPISTLLFVRALVVIVPDNVGLVIVGLVSVLLVNVRVLVSVTSLLAVVGSTILS